MNVILEVSVGSHAYGTAVPGDDVDIFGVAVETATEFIGFSPENEVRTREQPAGPDQDVDLHVLGLRSFLIAALNGEPEAMIPLFAPDECVRKIDGGGKSLRMAATRIVSRRAFRAHIDAMSKQYQDLVGAASYLDQSLIEKFGYDTRVAAKIYRTGVQGTELMRTGRIIYPMTEVERNNCLSIRRGEMSLDGASTLITNITTALGDATATSALPEEPNLAVIEKWMVAMYMYHWASRPKP